MARRSQSGSALWVLVRRESVICIFPEDEIFGIAMIINMIDHIRRKRLSILFPKQVIF
jgi:hypothetical protein